jgi:hypothetical protein
MGHVAVKTAMWPGERTRLFAEKRRHRAPGNYSAFKSVGGNHLRIFHRDLPHFAEPDITGEDLPKRSTIARMRDLWETVRYGPAGRVIGYCIAFALVFVIVTLLLSALEYYRF